MSDLILTDRAALALVDEAERALAAVDNPADADELWRKVKAVEEAARLARLSEVVVASMARVRLRAKRRYGELLGPAQTGRPQGNVTARHVSTNGDRKAVERARKLAAVPEDVFAAHLEQGDPDKLTEAAVLREGRKAERGPQNAAMKPKSRPPEVPLDTERQRQLANKAKIRMEKAVGMAGGIVHGFPHLRPDRAAVVATPEEVRDWLEVFREARAALRDLERRLEGQS